MNTTLLPRPSLSRAGLSEAAHRDRPAGAALGERRPTPATGLARSPYGQRHCARAGFTLLELLAAITITILLVLLLTTAFNQTSKAWLLAERQTDISARARVALEIMSRDISQAIISPVYTFLGHSNHVAFVKPANAIYYGNVDLEETTYQQWGQAPPYTLVLCQTTKIISTWWNVQSYRYYANTSPQIFSCPLPDPISVTRSSNWPKTVVYHFPLIDYVAAVKFEYKFFLPSGQPALSEYWNSDTGGETADCFANATVTLPAGQSYMTNLPWGVLITLDVMDARAANRLSPGMSATVSNNIINEAKRTFSIFAHIRAAQPSP